MAQGPLFKIKHSSGRILGPLDLSQVSKLVRKNQLTGQELARAYPQGEWLEMSLIPELAEVILQNAQGESGVTQTLSSAQSSYRPIMGETEQLAPTVILREEPPSIEPATTASPSPVLSVPAPLEPEDEATQRIDSSEFEIEDERTVRVERPRVEEEIPEIGLSLESHAEDRSGPSGLPAARSEFQHPSVTTQQIDRVLAQESTVMLERPGIEPPPGGRKFRIPNRSELIRVICVAVLLGIFGYEFMFEEPAKKPALFKKDDDFRPRLPGTPLAKPDPSLSQKYYAAAMKFYVADTMRGYKAAVSRLIKSVEADPENVKALSMLASCYINLIDTSNKDENFFAVISKLIEQSDAKTLDLAETTIAKVEFLIMTNRADAAVTKVVEYTKTHPDFDPSMFFYLSIGFYAKGDYENAAKYMAQYPDNKAFSPKIFQLRGDIAQKLGDVAQARSEYEKALKLNPEHSVSRLRLIALDAQEGRLKDAGGDIEKVVGAPDLVSGKTLAQAYYFYGLYFQLMEKYDLAFGALERAVKLDRGNHDYLLEYYTLKARKGGLAASAAQDARMYYHLGEGERALKEGRTQDALTEFLKARDVNGASTAPLVRIGDMFVQLNDLVNARLNYKKAADKSPNNIDVWSKYIYVLIQSFEWDEAQKAMDKFRKLPVSQSSIDKAAGDMYSKQGRFAEAMTFYKKAMLRENIDPDVYIAYANLLMETKNYKDAPFFYVLSQRFDPLNPEATIGIARAVANTESLDAGVRVLQDELKKDGVRRAALLAGIAEIQIQKGDFAAAQQYVDQAQQADPEYALPWKLQAQIHLDRVNTDKKALDKALDAYKSYSDRNTSDPSGYLERYRIFIRKSDFEAAGAELGRIYEIYPKYPNLHFYRGAMYGIMGNHKIAAEEYRAELANNPNSVSTLVALGKELVALGDGKAATVELNRAMQVAPTNPEAKFAAANANVLLKNYPGAIALYQAALRYDPGNPLIYKKMGQCYREMGDSAGARGAFKKYLEMEPDAADRSEFESYL